MHVSYCVLCFNLDIEMILELSHVKAGKIKEVYAITRKKKALSAFADII